MNNSHTAEAFVHSLLDERDDYDTEDYASGYAGALQIIDGPETLLYW